MRSAKQGTKGEYYWRTGADTESTAYEKERERQGERRFKGNCKPGNGEYIQTRVIWSRTNYETERE